MEVRTRVYLCKMEGGHTFSALGFASSSSFRRRFISLMQVARRPPGLISSTLPLSHKVSSVNEGSAREVVVERR